MKRYIGVQELASGFIRRGSSFMFPCVDFIHHLCFSVSLVPTYLDQAPVINIVCLCVPYLYLKDTSPAPSRPPNARTTRVTGLVRACDGLEGTGNPWDVDEVHTNTQ